MQGFLFRILLFWTVSKNLLLAWYEKRIFSLKANDCNQQRAFSGVVDVVEGDSFTLCCDVNRPANWTKNGVDVMALELNDNDSNRFKIEENSLGIRTHLSVSRAMYEQDNEVAYQCVATSPSGDAVVAERKVRVRRKAEVSFHGPRSLVVEATVGDNVALNCSGRHLFFIKWFKDGLFAGGASRYRVSSWRQHSHAIRGTVLYITSVQILDGGRYECRGYPQWGTLHRVVTVTLEVFPTEPPRFLEEPRSVLAHLNTTVSLRCSVVGRPRPRLYWIREGKVGGYRERLSGHVDVVTIRSLSHEDEGAYYCVAENSVASVPSSPAVISIIV
ncbi:roundabout homolog 3-like, partial [Oscarella lobularis]